MNSQDSNRQNGKRLEGEFELTAAEKKTLEELKKDRMPSDLLEERVVSALHQRGFLVRPHRRVFGLTLGRSFAAAAACLVLLALGFMLGQWTGSRQSLDVSPLRPVIEGFSSAATVQQTGSAYLLALQQFADVSANVESDQAKQGREVALMTLCAAADRVSRLVPTDVLAGQLLVSLRKDTHAPKGREISEITIDRSQVIEF